MEPQDLFEILVREHSDMVRAFLLSSVRDPGAVDDLVQETFLVAWKILDRYDRKLPFGPWVRGIAAKLLMNWRRKMGRSKVHFCDEESLHLLDRSFESLVGARGDTFDEKLDVLRSCMSVLSPAQRDAIVLHYEHGMHCKEIAQRLSISHEATKKHLQRGRASLMRCLSAKVEALGEPQ